MGANPKIFPLFIVGVMSMKELVSIGHKIAFELPGVPPETTVCSGDQMAREAKELRRSRWAFLCRGSYMGIPNLRAMTYTEHSRTLNSGE